MNKILFLTILLSSILTLQAQEKLNNNYTKRPALGVHFTLTDFKTANLIRTTSLNTVLLNKQIQKPRLMSPGLAVTYMKGFSNHIDVQARLAGSFLDLPIPGKSAFGSDYFFGEGDASAHLKMLSDKYWVSPYLSVGVGAALYKGTYWSAFAPLGAGLQVNFWDEAFMLINTQYRVPITSNNNYHFFHSIGFAGNIGVPKASIIPKSVVAPVIKDSDSDGILDNIDACPTVAGLAKYKGCPATDTDKDGLNDEDDKCPTVAGTAKYSGCPVPDSDGDGINDEEDKCPSQAGVARYNGCPIPDGDGDGVNDEDDKCPTVSGVIAQQGCPEINEKVTKAIEFAAKNILFETSSFKLKTSSYKGLNEVAKILTDNPDVMLSIDGHTDNSGDAEKNMTLSQNRADAVKSYLTKKGVEEGRLTATGHGQEEPVADNTTTAGKAKNRRVELKLSY
jgi:outer membrane protein OmpA-like peptidoglycan-associated protein